MIYLDIDGVCVDFVGTAKKFGVWKWCSEQCNYSAKSEDSGKFICKNGDYLCKAPTPKQFYKVAEPQPWAGKLIDILSEYWFEGDSNFEFITADYAEIKTDWLHKKLNIRGKAIEAPDKSVHCQHPNDLLIDDNAAECKRWRDKGGIAYWFNLAEDDPFGKFLKWWRLGK